MASCHALLFPFSQTTVLLSEGSGFSGGIARPGWRQSKGSATPNVVAYPTRSKRRILDCCPLRDGAVEIDDQSIFDTTLRNFFDRRLSQGKSWSLDAIALSHVLNGRIAFAFLSLHPQYKCTCPFFVAFCLSTTLLPPTFCIIPSLLAVNGCTSKSVIFAGNCPGIGSLEGTRSHRRAIKIAIYDRGRRARQSGYRDRWSVFMLHTAVARSSYSNHARTRAKSALQDGVIGACCCH